MVDKRELVGCLVRLFPLFWLVGMDESTAAQIHRRVYTDNHGNGFGRVEESCM